MIKVFNMVFSSLPSNPVNTLALTALFFCISDNIDFIFAIANLSSLFNLYKFVDNIISNFPDSLKYKPASLDKYCFLSLGFICIILL